MQWLLIGIISNMVYKLLLHHARDTTVSDNIFSEKKQEVGDKGDKKIYPYSIYCYPTSLSLPFDPPIT